MKMTRSLAVVFVSASLLAFAAPVAAQSGRGHGGNPNHGAGGDWHHHDWRHGGRVNVFFGGFGYPFFYGYPYWGYPSYGYAPGYGYGYPGSAYYTYDPRGIYQGRVVDRDGKGNNSVIAQIQQQLSAGGYYHGEIDGIIGNATRRAIRNYERDNNLPVDGRIDGQLLATMGLG